MAKLITKGLIGIQDLSIGTSTFTRATSVGGTQVLNQINSTNLGSGFPLNLSSPIIPTGAINGTNAIFTLPTAPGLIVLVFLNGVLSFAGGAQTYDYTLVGSTITFNNAPPVGSRVTVVY